MSGRAVNSAFNKIVALGAERGQSLYNVCHRSAGWAIQWHDQARVKTAPPPELEPGKNGPEVMAINQKRLHEGLVIHHYYPTLAKCLHEEKLRLLEEKREEEKKIRQAIRSQGGSNMKNVMMVVLTLAVVGLSGCGGVNRSLSKGEIKDVWEKVSDKETIRVRGIGVAPTGIASQTQRRGLSRNAALVNARYEALALLRGIKVTGGLSVGSLIEKDSHIKEVANQVIAGMEEVQVEFSKDDGAVVLLELDRSKLERMLADVGAADSSESYRTLSQQASAQVAKLPGVAQ